MKIKLLIILLLIFSFVLGRISAPEYNLPHIENTNELSDNLLIQNQDCPYTTNLDIDLTFGNEVSVAYPPKPLFQKEIIFPKQKFNPDADTFEGSNIYSPDKYPGVNIEETDIDSDGQIEQIVSINVAMNHTPHVALIVKNGDIIFKEEGAQTYIFEAFGEGFKVHKTINWETGEESITKYKYKNNTIIPIWEQKLCNVRVSNK